MKKLMLIWMIFWSLTGISREVDGRGNMAGLGVIVVDDGYRDMDAQVFPIPFVMVETERFFVQGPRLGVHLYRNGENRLDLTLTPGFGGFDADDSPYFDGMEDRDMAVFAGIQWGHQISRFYSMSIGISTDVTGNADGLRGEIGLNRNWFAGQWVLTGSLGLEWLSSDVVDYYYGVRPNEARPDRSAYTGTDSWNTSLSFMATRPFGKRAVFMGIVGYGRYGSGISESPLLERDSALFSLVGVGWRF